MTVTVAAVVDQARPAVVGHVDRIRSPNLVPVDLVAILREQNVGLAFRHEGSGKHGLGFLIHEGSQTTVVVRRDPGRAGALSARERFTIAHEIGHLVWDQRVGVPATGQRDYWLLESICNEFAGHLLVPTLLLQEQLGSCPEYPRDLIRLARELTGRYGVSMPVMAKRLVDIEPNLLLAEIVLPTIASSRNLGRLSWIAQRGSWISINAGAQISEKETLATLVFQHAVSKWGEVKETTLDNAADLALASMMLDSRLLIAGIAGGRTRGQ